MPLVSSGLADKTGKLAAALAHDEELAALHDALSGDRRAELRADQGGGKNCVFKVFVRDRVGPGEGFLRVYSPIVESYADWTVYGDPCRNAFASLVISPEKPTGSYFAQTVTGEDTLAATLSFLDALGPTDKDQLDADLAAAVSAAGTTSDEQLSARLAAAPAKPERVRVAATAFRRNPHVVVAVLRRAGGVCEQCRQPAPFARVSAGSPFLEVHHDVPLADGGDDTVANARALCPNCHRDAHHGPASVRPAA